MSDAAPFPTEFYNPEPDLTTEYRWSPDVGQWPFENLEAPLFTSGPEMHMVDASTAVNIPEDGKYGFCLALLTNQTLTIVTAPINHQGEMQRELQNNTFYGVSVSVKKSLCRLVDASSR